jgi:hypothetical protein
LGSSVKSNILEAINLTLFHLVNDDIDQNLKVTGAQLMILSAGTGTYRVVPAIANPTKDRIICGGLPVNLISFGQQPPYKTPLFVNCCSYENPFVKEEQGIK